MAGFLANFGLVAEGADQSRLTSSRLALEDQRLADEKQAGQLRGQEIERGKMGLEDATRSRAAAESERAAVSGSSGGMDQTYDAVGKARRASGNLAGVEDANTRRQQNAVRALVDLAHDAQIGTDPRQAEEKLRRAGFAQDAEPGSMTYGMNPETKDQMIMFKDKNGQMHAINGTQILQSASKMEVHPIGAQGSVITQPGAPPRVIGGPRAPVENPQHGYEKVTRKDSDGNETTDLIDIRPTIDGKPNPNFQKKVDLGGGDAAAPGGSSPKNLQTVKAIEDAVKERDGMWQPKANPSDPTAPPIKVLTPKGEEVTVAASQIWEANKRTMNHQTAIALAQNGKLMLNRSTGEMMWEAGGKRYKMSQMPGEPIQSAPPVAPARTQNDLPKVKPGTPADAPIGDQPAPVAAPQTAATTSPTGTAQEIFDKEGITGVLARLEKAYPPKETAGGGRSGATKRKVDSAEVAEFKKKKGRDALAYADSLLSKRQVAGYRRGGKVQRYGLG